MHRLLVIAALLFASGAFHSRAAELTNKFQFDGDALSISQEKTVASARHMTVTYGDISMYADLAALNWETGEAIAEGNVRIERGAQVWQGERVEYNFKTGKLVSEQFRSGQNPFFVKGDVIVGEQKTNVYVGVNARVTTDDSKSPGYSVRARSITVVPGEYIEARNATLHLGNVPVFFFPYYRRSLKQHPNHWTLTPGYRSSYGAFLRTAYNWYWDQQLDGKIDIDGYTKRGVGVGPEFNWHLPRFGEGTAGYYYIHDLDPGEDSSGQPIAPDRQRAFLKDLAEPRTNLTVRLAVQYQSDAFVIRDFFESEYREDVQPKSFLEVNQLWRNYSLDLLGQVQVNPFFETVERLPDVRLTGFRQQIGPTPLYYDSESSAGYYRRNFADTDTNNSGFAASRFDTFQQFTAPFTLFGWLNVTPRVGGRFTHYSEADGRGATTDEEDRGVFNTGAEVNFKVSRLWRGVSSRFWQMDGLRHIIQPSFNYVFVPHPTRSPSELPQFDYELPSTRPLPLDYPDYNAIDSIDSQNVLRLGLRNKLQTKRDGTVQNVVHWALLTDWRLNTLPSQSTFSDVYSDLELRPFRWLAFNSEVRYDLDAGMLDISDNRIVLTPNDTWSLTLGHRYVRDNALEPLPTVDPGNNLFFTTLYYRFNENWATRINLQFEARDGTLEEQYYTIYRDLRSWTAALTFRIRENRTGPADYTVALAASLKAFPRFRVGEDRVRPTKLLGY